LERLPKQNSGAGDAEEGYEAESSNLPGDLFTLN
jgi:hypothetical protein